MPDQNLQPDQRPTTSDDQSQRLRTRTGEIIEESRRVITTVGALSSDQLQRVIFLVLIVCLSAGFGYLLYRADIDRSAERQSHADLLSAQNRDSAEREEKLRDHCSRMSANESQKARDFYATEAQKMRDERAIERASVVEIMAKTRDALTTFSLKFAEMERMLRRLAGEKAPPESVVAPAPKFKTSDG